jgi:phosphomannomutase
MRDNDAVYGGEISGHHYFRNFSFCDSGMIPWLLICSVLGRTDEKLSELIHQYQSQYPASDEINRRVDDAGLIMKQVEEHYTEKAKSIEHIDGLSMSFEDWRFNLRMSNTEPLLRLNVETVGDEDMLKARVSEVLGLYE